MEEKPGSRSAGVEFLRLFVTLALFGSLLLGLIVFLLLLLLNRPNPPLPAIRGLVFALAIVGPALPLLSSRMLRERNPKPATEPDRSALRTLRSIHHLFSESDRLLPKSRDHAVDLAVDAADLPEGFLLYLKRLARSGIEARVLLLDPSSPLVSRHRFSADEDSDVSRPATESIRAKMRKAIAQVREHATVRLYDAMPLGNLVIVDNHIFHGGIPSVPTDVSLPLVEMTADIHGHLYWSYRRNFDRLWEAALPVGATEPLPTAAVSPAAAV